MTDAALISADAVRARMVDASRAAGSQKAWAAQHGMSQAYVSDVLSGRREPGDSILAALGLVRVVGYCPA